MYTLFVYFKLFYGVLATDLTKFLTYFGHLQTLIFFFNNNFNYLFAQLLIYLFYIFIHLLTLLTTVG